ncbi:MAG: hypothetical protein ABII22_00160 [Candidatus Micrarchaeota archaeon]
MEGEVSLDLALLVVSASIILSGIILGLGRAISNKRLESFGLEELAQSIVNAAIVGAIVLIVGTLTLIGSDISQNECIEGDVITDLSCSFERLSSNSFDLLDQDVQALQIIGYYQTLNLDFGSFSIQPFTNLKAVSDTLSSQVQALQISMILIDLNLQILFFVSQNALGLLLSVGLILRVFFATRKMGGFVISVSIALFLVYPSFISIFPDPINDVVLAVNTTARFNSNPGYATVPIIDLNNNYAIAQKIDLMSGRNTTNMTEAEVDFTQDLTQLIDSNSNAISKITLYSILAPLFSLIVTIVFVKELTNILGGEIFSSTIKFV